VLSRRRAFQTRVVMSAMASELLRLPNKAVTSGKLLFLDPIDASRNSLTLQCAGTAYGRGVFSSPGKRHHTVRLRREGEAGLWVATFVCKGRDDLFLALRGVEPRSSKVEVLTARMTSGFSPASRVNPVPARMIDCGSTELWNTIVRRAEARPSGKVISGRQPS